MVGQHTHDASGVHHHHAAPFGMAAEYAHPVETLFLGLGTLLGPFLFAEHIVTVWVRMPICTSRLPPHLTPSRRWRTDLAVLPPVGDR